MLPAWLISIHAPSRERRLSPAKVRRCAVFNPRSLAGATINAIDDSTNIRHFNPRSLAGATVFQFLKIYLMRYFNPRSLAGATSSSVASFTISRFQSTLPRGSDQARSSSAPAPTVFQSTLPRGSDILPMSWTDCKRYFNPRSLAGATEMSQKEFDEYVISIHAPSRERPFALVCI